ncbi:MAG: metallophosphoesterase [Bacillota bacterium]|nr:metallophosphoesterase [Bacillota bacterium]
MLTILAAAALYLLLNYYIGRNGLKIFGKNPKSLYRWMFWILFWIISLSYLLARIPSKFLPAPIGKILNLTGSYWLAFILYSLMIIIFINLIRLADRFFHFIPAGIKEYKYTSVICVIAVFIIVISILVYGTWNANNPRVQKYSVNINKNSSLKYIHAVMVSDIHLGLNSGKSEVDGLKRRIIALHPQIVFVVGDLVDEGISGELENYLAASLSGIKTSYGVFAVMGNHEYYSGQADKLTEVLEKTGINVLRDKVDKVEDSFYVIGREDKSVEERGGKRASIKQLVDNLDKDMPLIMLDHQPYNLEEAQNCGIDIQLSGHTHKGQIFPLGLITKLTYELDWGIMKKGSYNVIVSSGYGTWGPPIRTGNYPEIVDIDISFNKK